MRILVIDDDTDIRQFLKERLEADCFVVDTAGDGADGSYMARIHDYDAVILDYVLPRKNGVEVLKDIRADKKTMPVLMLSVQSEIDDKTNLLDLGADDYMTKPFSYRELVSRIRALVRRQPTLITSILKAGDFVLDTVNQRASRGLREIYLTRKEFTLAEYLMRNGGFVVSRGTLMEHVWQSDTDPSSNTIEVHMRNLRRKVDDGSEKKLIRTIPGRGYKIDAQRRIFS